MTDVLTTEELLGNEPDTDFDNIWKRTMSEEGGFTIDHAGPTNYGITQSTYDSYRKSKGQRLQDVKTISPVEAKDIARHDFYEKPKINQLPKNISSALFDFGYNAGPKTAIKTLQEAVGTKADGVIGPNTIKALNDKINQVGEKAVIKNIIDQRENHYRSLIESNPEKYKKFENGWFNRLKRLRSEFNISSLNPFSATEAEAATATNDNVLTSDELGIAKDQNNPDIMSGDELFGKPDVMTTDDLLRPQPSLVEKVAGNIVNSGKQLGLSLIGSTQQAAASINETVNFIGKNIQAVGEGLDTPRQDLVDSLNSLDDINLPAGEKEFIRKDLQDRIKRIDENKFSTEKLIENIGEKISTFAEENKRFWIRARNETFQKRDPALFQGTFMQNPSWLRGASIVAEAVPSLAAATAIGAITKNPWAGAAAISFGLDSIQQFEEAQQAGKSLPESDLIYLTSGIGTTILERIPITRFLRGGEGKLTKDIFIGATQEGLEEVAQQLWQNSIAKLGYDATRQLTEGMVESFIGGAGSGGVIGGVTSGRAVQTDALINEAQRRGISPDEINGMFDVVSNQIKNSGQEIDQVISDNVKGKIAKDESGKPIEVNSEIPKKAEQIPQFKNTQEAFAYGEKIKGNKEAIDNLNKAREEQAKVVDDIHNIDNPTDQDLQRGLNEATKGQFLREAYEVATETGIAKTAKKFMSQENKIQQIKQAESSLIEEAKKYKTAEEFVKDYQKLYHGGSEVIIGDKLVLNGRVAGEVTQENLGKGQDYGGIFFTPSKDLAQTFAGHSSSGKGAVHTFAVKTKGVFDESSPSHAKKLKDFIGKKYINQDGESVEFTKQMYDFIFPKLEDGKRHMDWATFDANILEAIGFEGAKIIENYGVEGKLPLYTYVLFKGGKESPHFKIKNNEQLNSIWEQAHKESKPKEPASLKKEAAQVILPQEPAKSPQDLLNRIDQLNKFGQSKAILRGTSRMKKAAGKFAPIPKEGVVKIGEGTIQNPSEYLSTLGHELGHAIEFNVTGKISMRTTPNKKSYALFGDDIDFKKIHDELIAVSEDLVGKATMNSKPEYYFQTTELIARFFEKIIASPGNMNDLAPYTLDLLEKQAIKYPIIQEFLEAANQGIDKGAPKVTLLRDLKQTYEKHLGKRVGSIAFGEEISYRAMKERGKIVIENFIKEKFKGIKDDPETLFRAAESIKISKEGIPDFGTRDYVTAKTEEEEKSLAALDYELMPEPVIEDGIAYPQYGKWRYTPEQAKAIFDSLSDKGKRIITDFTAERSEAKDYFNREVIKEVNKIQGNIEGWVYHYFESKPSSSILGGKKFKKRIAGTRRQRTGVEGYVLDFQKSMTKVLIDLEGEKVYNDFIKRQFARVTQPIGEGDDPKPGWVEVQGNIKSGVGLSQEKKMVLVDKATGKKIPIRQSRYQMPKEIYERYRLWRGLIDEATTAVRVVNDINRYWRINILTHPGTAMTNHISGAIQYSTKILSDFYTEVLTGDVKFPKTRNNISAMLKVLLPKGWAEAPDWVYGGDLSNFYGQFMKQKSPVSAAIDTYGNKALKLFGAVERYWKKVILLSDNVSDISSLNKMTKEGLRLPTEEERNFIAKLNEEVDLYAYDYDNVPAWLEAHQKSVLGQAIKPFAKYPYKYAKHILNLAGAAFDGTLPWQERVSKVLTLTTIVAAYAAFQKKRKEEQETPIAEKNIEIPARLQTRGRLFVATDENGRELFVRVAKYPFINLTQAGMELVDGNFEGAKDGVSEMIGSIGPAAQIGLLAFNYRNKYQTYDTVPIILGDSLVTFVPGYRILNDVSRMLDPFKRKEENFAQTFTKIIPTTDAALQEKLHGKIRTERVPIEGNIKSDKSGRRTTVDYQLENYWQDVLLSMLSGIYINRVDPDIAEAYIIRKTENLEKRQKNENK